MGFRTFTATREGIEFFLLAASSFRFRSVLFVLRALLEMLTYFLTVPGIEFQRTANFFLKTVLRALMS